MPQMSPMMWLMMYFYVIFLLLIVMILLYYLFTCFNKNEMMNCLLKEKFYFKW